jgi:hypothetical protein
VLIVENDVAIQYLVQLLLCEVIEDDMLEGDIEVTNIVTEIMYTLQDLL